MTTGNDKCTVSPKGWYCTRLPGHDGPCAALPDVAVEKPDETAFSYAVTRKQAEQAKVWCDHHDRDKHAKEFKYGQRYSGAIGGAYTWQFVPTSLGTITVVRCSCGEELNVTDWDNFG